MIFSLENYKRLRGEINHLLTEGEDLMEEDEFLIDLISSSKNLEGFMSKRVERGMEFIF